MEPRRTPALRRARWGLLAGLALLASGCSSPQPVANFSASVTVGRAPLEVLFTDLSTGDPTTWEWDFGDGTISAEESPTHTYTIVGTYQVTLLAAKDTDVSQAPKTLSITVDAGILDQVEVTPEEVQVGPQEEQAFSVRAFDAFGNSVPAFTTRWSVDVAVGSVDSQGNFVANSNAGDFPAAVEAVVSDGLATRSVGASVIVLPGPLDRVELSPQSVTLSAGESREFTGVTYDRFGNRLPETELLWRLNDEVGSITSAGRFSATKVGEHIDAIVVEATEDDVSKNDVATVTIMQGSPSRVEVSPSTILLRVRTGQRLAATVFDQFGNEILEPALRWEVPSEAGTIGTNGLLIAGTKVGEYQVTASSLGNGDQTIRGTATLSVEPGTLDRVHVSPAPATVTAGAVQQFTATAYDQYDNEIPDVSLRWRTRQEAGEIGLLGLLSASTETGMHADAVAVEAIEGSVAKVDRVTVAVDPGPPSRIEVRPNPVTLLRGQTQAFTATVLDQYGNEIRDATVAWSVLRGGGIIDEDGMFTAGEDLDTFEDTILVEAEHQGASASSKVTVVVSRYLPGKIVFNAIIDGDVDIFQIDPDGSNMTRLTHDQTTNHHAAWSPDGSKIVFTTWRDGNAEIYVMDADGGNQVRLTDEAAFDGWASWSPSGDRIAFTSARVIGGYDIFVMDADGGNPTRLTENRRLDTDVRPYWSPDGNTILYTSDEGSEFDLEVWVMNADGTGKRQLTDNQDTDVGLGWFPDGSRILFLSDRDGQDDLDLYTINPDGSDIGRLTNTPRIAEDLSAFSPDGTKIVFINGFDQQVWVMDADGRNPSPITEGMVLAGYPQWQPISEVPVQSLVAGATVLPETDEEAPGEHFPIDPASELLPDEEIYTKYTTIPPTSGPYWERAAPWGIYSSPIAYERQVANLAQGGVIIQYNTEDEEMISQLKEFVRGQDDSPCHLVLAPNPDMTFVIAVTAWGVRDTLEEFDEARLQSFADAYRGKGPEPALCPA